MLSWKTTLLTQDSFSIREKCTFRIQGKRRFCLIETLPFWDGKNTFITSAIWKDRIAKSVLWYMFTSKGICSLVKQATLHHCRCKHIY